MDSKLANEVDVNEPERMASGEMESGSNCVERELAGKVRQKDCLANSVSGSDGDAAGTKWAAAK